MEDKTLSKIVREHYKLDARTNRLINSANFDLYFGPFPAGEDIDWDTGENAFIYPGFQEAMREINDVVGSVSEIWVDTQCEYVSEKEPQGEEIDGGYIEPFWEDWYHLERKDVLRYLVGNELHKYL